MKPDGMEKSPNDEQYEIAMKDLEKAGEALCQK